MHWACAKITASLAIPDTTLLEILLDKVPLPPPTSNFFAIILVYATTLELHSFTLS